MLNIFGKIFLLNKNEAQDLKLRSASEVRKDFKRRSDRNNVIAAIENAAQKNQTETSVAGWLSQELKDELLGQGYKITEFEYGYEKRTSIEW